MQNILITWTSSWIWEFLAKNFLEKYQNDYKIFWLSRKNPKRIILENKNFSQIICDLKNFWEIEKKFLEIKKNNKNFYFDKIILNAWIWYFENFETMKTEEIFEIIQINLLSNIFLIKFLLDNNFLNISKNNSTKIIFIWSKASKKFWNNWAAYLASKFWLRWFAWWLNKDLKNIWIHLINPRVVKTNFHKNSKIDIQSTFWKYSETWIEKIFSTCEKIFNWKEENFEIDL